MFWCKMPSVPNFMYKKRFKGAKINVLLLLQWVFYSYHPTCFHIFISFPFSFRRLILISINCVGYSTEIVIKTIGSYSTPLTLKCERKIHNITNKNFTRSEAGKRTLLLSNAIVARREVG